MGVPFMDKKQLKLKTRKYIKNFQKRYGKYTRKEFREWINT